MLALIWNCLRQERELGSGGFDRLAPRGLGSPLCLQFCKVNLGLKICYHFTNRVAQILCYCSDPIPSASPV